MASLTNVFVVVVLEYLVPSTGKLYHHKMKLRQLSGDSDPDEMLLYLEKRHPLYFVQRKLSKPQIKNLLKKLIFKLSQSKPRAQPGIALDPPSSSPPNKPKPAAITKQNPPSDIFSQNKKQHLKDLENKAKEKENQHGAGGLSSLQGAPAFKTGGQLPTLTDDFPPLGGAKKPSKAAAGFGFDEAFDDDFSEGDPESPNEANNEDEEDDEDEDGDFDANELLNLNSYKQKRASALGPLGGGGGMGGGLGRDKESPLPSLNPINAKTSAPSKLPDMPPPKAQVAPPAQRSILGTTA